ncbi:CgeB family protein [Limibacterium fermenti]|uniref:CgeB family protein n=1 Tax=Limibacterium fermenti TaxID=3229863 RepID=UPI000E913584|nr:glycosyltransferase family 1 protein [Porphyromonadaceae bacterium]
MNILYHFREDNTYMTQWQRVHIFDELSRHNIHISIFNPSLYESISQANEKLIDVAKKGVFRYDVFMTAAGDTEFEIETIERIREIGIPTLLICFDNLQAPYMHKKIASHFDLVWITSSETKKMFEQWGCRNIVFQPYAANPFIFRPVWEKPIPTVGFVGTPYGSRKIILSRLMDAQIYCAVYSNAFASSESVAPPARLSFRKKCIMMNKQIRFDIGRKVLISGWKNKILNRHAKIETYFSDHDYLIKEKSVPFEQMVSLYSNHTLSLNITELADTFLLKTPVYKLHLRTFEIPMSGGLAITPYTPELATYFEDGEEIVFYRSMDELISKTKFYLEKRNEKIVSAMKRQARKRAENEHTWMNRFRILDRLV